VGVQAPCPLSRFGSFLPGCGGHCPGATAREKPAFHSRPRQRRSRLWSRRLPGAAQGTLEGPQEAPPPPPPPPPPPGGLSDPLPDPCAPGPLPPGDPLSPTPSGTRQDTPLRRPGLSRPRPASGEPQAPILPLLSQPPHPGRPSRERDRGGDGDWAAARGRSCEARPPPSLVAPPPSPPRVLARRPPSAALSPGRPTPDPLPPSPPAPPPLPLLPLFPERPAGAGPRWQRGGVTESPGWGRLRLGVGDAERRPGELATPAQRAPGEQSRAQRGQVGARRRTRSGGGR
jgi:hypothetical protein